jgi:indolepyruvate ferredoxin oxidoreductase, beta subunit
MSFNRFDIYMLGVGGQGIGLLSEALARAADHAGIQVRGVDTHGLAQRGGTVVSNLRLGPRAFSPLVEIGTADLVIALERHEAVRGVSRYLRENGTLVYYDAVWQPLDVRLGKGKEATAED